jgi:hypothetical protein
MLKTILIAGAGIAIGFLANIYFNYAPPVDFLQVKLIDILRLIGPLGLGSYIAFHFSKKLNKMGKKRELLCSSIDCIGTDYDRLFDKLRIFIQDTSTIDCLDITLSLKSLSSKLSILERRKDIGINQTKLSNLRNSHEALNNVITGDTWGKDAKKIKYSEDHKATAEKEMKSIENHIEELKYSLFD